MRRKLSLGFLKTAYRRHLAPVVFAVFVLGGITGSLIAYRSENAAAVSAFQVNAHGMIDRIHNRVEQHLTLLESTGAFASVIGDGLNATSFRTYIDLLRLKEAYGGVLSIGFAPLIETGKEAPVVAEIAAAYNIQRDIWPATDQTLRAPVLLLEPQDQRSKATLGYDMYFDLTHREAIIRAMQGRKLTVTAPLELQERGGDKQSGFVAYLAVSSLLRDTTRPRGVFYASFNAGDLHHAVLGNNSRAPIEIQTRDTTNGQDVLLYQTPHFANSAASVAFLVSQTVTVGGREWTISARPGQGYETVSHIVTFSLAAAFLALAVAASAATLWQVRAMETAETLRGVRARMVEDKDMLLQEMKHRMKNSIARIVSVARQTGLSSTSIAAFNTSFSARLQAIASAQEMLTRSLWRQADLRSVLRKELEQVFGAMIDKIVLSGPDVMLAGRTVQSLGLTFHELATNSLKYGAAGSADGEVAVYWRVIEDKRANKWLELEWRELRLLTVFNGSRKGFGTRLIDINIRSQLGGTIDRLANANALAIRIRIPLAPLE